MKKITFILFLIFSLNAYSQKFYLPLNFQEKNKILKEINKNNQIIHTEFWPPVSYDLFDIDSLSKKNQFILKRKKQFIWSKLLTDDLVKVKSKNLEFSFNLLFDIHQDKIKNDSLPYWQNTRGFEISGRLGKKLFFYTDFFENQGYFVPYIDSFIQTNFVIPGQGGWKIFGKDLRGRDYNYASGYLSFSPSKNFNIQFGHSKNFIGAGYRSLLLSDNSFNYPFAKFTFTKGKFQYTTMFTQFQHFKTKYYFYHYTNHGTFTFINYSPFSNTEIGLFEGIIWHTSDDSTYINKIPFPFFIPIPGVREIFYGLNNQNNILLGLNFRRKLYDYSEIYGQFVLDDFSSNNFRQRYGYQTGLKFYDIFAGKFKNISLFGQAEYNFAKPYLYSHNQSSQSYSNSNQPLASPLGAGFKEIVIISYLNFFDFQIFAKYNNILTAYDRNKSNFGSNILLSNYSADFKNSTNFVGQGNKTKINYWTLNINYEINTKTHFRIFIELTKRNFQDDFIKKDLFFVSFGIKNYLKNFYTDI